MTDKRVRVIVRQHKIPCRLHGIPYSDCSECNMHGSIRNIAEAPRTPKGNLPSLVLSVMDDALRNGYVCELEEVGE